MSRPRISIRHLLALVVFFGLGLAALRHASPLVAGLVLLATLVLLTVAPLGIVYRREGRRGWWIGFALFGSVHAALTLTPWSRPEALPTAGLLDHLYARIIPTKVVALQTYGLPKPYKVGDSFVVSATMIPPQVPPTAGPDAVYLVSPVGIEPFKAVGHSLLTLLAGWVGGLVGRAFYATRDER